MASLIPDFEYDIFISYRQNDNKYDGWVTEFIDNLTKELEATSKDKISIYFDANPHDGLLETHLVSSSLESKLKCLIFIPVISRTYCDPNCYAWTSEFLSFIKIAGKDRFGINVKLGSGNFASRILPVRIHDLDPEDIKLVEAQLGFIRSIDFIYKSPGVNRPLRAHEDHPHDNQNKTYYRDQINKVANAADEILRVLRKKQLNMTRENQESGHALAETENQESKSVHDELNKPGRKVSRIRSSDRGRIFKVTKTIILIAVMLSLAFSGFRIFYLKNKREYARNELLPQIQKMTEENFTAPYLAYDLAVEAEKYIPDDSVLIQLWPKISSRFSLQTEPAGAGLFWKDYDHPENPWIFIGNTPLRDFRIPYGYKRMILAKEGYDTIHFTFLLHLRPDTAGRIKMDRIGTIDPDMVHVPSRVAYMEIVGLESHAGKNVNEFLIDKYEVTNREFKKFVDAGGYSDRSYWNFPFYLNNREIKWEDAMKLFVDRTGRQGPAGWEVGTYQEGLSEHPVSGISWYEASAYAEFAGKQLPTVYHWSIVAETGRSMNIIPLSNFNGKSTVPVGTTKGMSTYGIYDLAGNVREWCRNGNGINGEYYISGGGYNDATYSFNDAYTQSSFDRSLTNGFRCIKILPGDSTYIPLSEPIKSDFRDYRREKPVDDNTFRLFLRQYEYDRTPLNAVSAMVEQDELWKVEKVTIDAGYNRERMDIYLFIPEDATPPYQPVIFLSGSNVIFTESFSIKDVKRLDFFVKSGRVIVFPVLKGTFERKDELNSDYQAETVFYKDHLVMWRRDVGRTIDYLETREDFLSEKIGYFGWSWGGFLGGILPAVEKRIKAVVLNVGGMEMTKAFPEADQINFLPRVTQPVLMLNGKYDMYFPVETSQKPMFDLLGTPAGDKKMIVYNSGHLVPRTDLIRESLAWFDKYLGPVKR